MDNVLIRNETKKHTICDGLWVTKILFYNLTIIACPCTEWGCDLFTSIYYRLSSKYLYIHIRWIEYYVKKEIRYKLLLSASASASACIPIYYYCYYYFNAIGNRHNEQWTLYAMVRIWNRINLNAETENERETKEWNKRNLNSFFKWTISWHLIDNCNH